MSSWSFEESGIGNPTPGNFFTVAKLGLSCKQSQANSGLVRATYMRILLESGVPSSYTACDPRTRGGVAENRRKTTEGREVFVENEPLLLGRLFQTPLQHLRFQLLSAHIANGSRRLTFCLSPVYRHAESHRLYFRLTAATFVFSATSRRASPNLLAGMDLYPVIDRPSVCNASSTANSRRFPPTIRIHCAFPFADRQYRRPASLSFLPLRGDNRSGKPSYRLRFLGNGNRWL